MRVGLLVNNIVCICAVYYGSIFGVRGDFLMGSSHGGDRMNTYLACVLLFYSNDGRVLYYDINS